jgi:cephalosporin-C deacetylase
MNPKELRVEFRQKFQWVAAVCTLLLLTVAVPAPAQDSGPSPSAQKLENIHRFWQQTLAKSAQVPLEAEVEKVKDYLPYEKYRVTYRSTDGVSIRGNLARPVEAANAGTRLPAIITVPGYGGWQQGIMLDDCMRGYIVLMVYPRSQGESADLWKIDGPDKLTWHIAHPEGYYYQGAYVDIIRAVDYLVSRPDVDSTRIGAMGTSQGGGLVLALAALDPRVKAVTAHLPFMCNFRLTATIENSLVRKLLQQYGDMNESSFNTLDYFDPYILADQIKAPALVSTGGKDQTCPAAGIRSAFDRLGGIKALAYYPDLSHTSCGDFYKMSWEWMDRHLKP